MTSPTRQTLDRRRRRPWWLRPVIWLIWVMAISVFLVAAALLLIQTRPFKNWARDYAVARVNESISGELAMARLDGNFLSHLELSGVTLSLKDDTVATIASIRVRYDLWALFDNVVKIDSLVMDSVCANARQSSDSVWNLARLLPPDTLQALPEDTAAGFGYVIELADFVLSNASVEIEAIDSLVPRRVDNIYIHLSGRYSTDRQNLSLHSLELYARQPDLWIRNLAFEMVSDTSNIAINDLVLETPLNTVTASANLNIDDMARSTAAVKTGPIQMHEFAAFLPPSIAAMQPIVTLSATLSGDTARTFVSMTAENQKISLLAVVAAVSAIIDTTVPGPARYKANAEMQNVALADWLGNPEIDVLLHGSIALTGTGVDPNELTVGIGGHLSRCVIHGHPVSTLSFKTNYARGSAEGTLTGLGEFGRISVSGKVSDLLELPAYRIAVDMANLDLSKLVLPDTLPTDINLSATIEGLGFSPDSMKGEARLDVRKSSFKDLTIDGGFTSFAYTPDGLRIDTMALLSSALTLGIAGSLSWDKSGELTYSLRLDDASMLTDLTKGSLLGGHGRVFGRAVGKPDSLSLETEIDFADLSIETATLSELTGELKTDYVDSVLSGVGWIGGRNITTNGALVDSILVSGRFDLSSFNGTIGVGLANSLRTDASIALTLDSLVKVVLKDISILYRDTRWSGASDSTVVTMTDDGTYDIANFRLVSKNAQGEEQSISIDGTISLSGRSELRAVISDLDLKPLASLYDLELGGTLSAEFGLTGTAADPRADGQLMIADGSYQQFRYHQLGGTFAYGDRRTGFNLNFKPTSTDSLMVSGSVPVVFTLADTSGVEPFSDTVSVSVKAERLPLSILKAAGYHVEQADGHLSCDLQVSNTMDNPHLQGGVSVRDGSLRMPNYGINYQNIIADIGFQPNRVVLDSLAIKDRTGTLKLSGTVEYDSSIISGNISSSRFEAVAKDFYVVSHRDYEIQITSDVNLEGTQSGASYGGQIAVNRSRFYLPAFVNMTNQDALDEMARPMLVAATFPDSMLLADSVVIPGGAPASDSARSAFVDNLRGSLKIVIPRNTWVTSPDLKLEMAGEIDVVKNGPDFELFGPVKVVRGHYQLYGKRFTIKRGELIFRGGADYIAALDIEAAYVFRTATREKKTLRLFVSGTSQMPVVSFTLDAAEISEGDAVSYIVFGRSLDELTQGQRSSVSGDSESGSVAGSVAANLLAGQLSRALGNKLNLDVIEIKAQGDLQSAAVVIGKYLTPDLFMSYQRSFGSASDDNLVPETVTLEYQLTRLIYLQLTQGDPEETGFDVIVKLQKK